MPRSGRVLLLLLILLAAALRFPALFSNHFHADEALFAAWARLIAIWRDPLLLAQNVDKPPLLFYLQALAYPLFGPVEWAARLPNLAASLLTIPLTAVLAWRFYHHTFTSLMAALIVVSSPLAIQFSATAFTDPLLTAWLMAALLWLALPARPLWAGLFFGLAVLTKYQAWIFLPLALALAWLYDWQKWQWRRALLGFVPPLALFLLWQFLRSGRLDLWGEQLTNFGGLRLTWSFELLPRLASWSTLWSLSLGSALLPVLFLVATLALWWQSRGDPDRHSLVDRLLILFVLSYFGLHWLLAVPVWDRYLLPLLPLVALVIARGAALLMERLPVSGRWALLPAALLLILMLLVQAPTALEARAAGLPLGGSPDADQGAWQVAEYLDQAPYGTVLYDHWYSWHWRYSFIDKGVYISWFPHPQALIKDLAVFGRDPGERFLVLPAGDQARPVLRAVAGAGFSATPVLHTTASPGMILYRLRLAKGE
ncbi:MAG: ArnT family glycosyltransferase [Candidatus Promineifilaceae bacterium]